MHISSSQGLGIIAEEGNERVQDSMWWLTEKKHLLATAGKLHISI